MKGVRSKFKEFQMQPDFVVTPKLGPKLQAYILYIGVRENHERLIERGRSCVLL
jgi:hypothetical protein